MSSRPKRAASANMANVIAAEKAAKAAALQDAHAKYIVEYRKTERGRAVTAKANAKYAKTERGRAVTAKANAKYAKTERGRAVNAKKHAKYAKTERGRANNAKKHAKYAKTERGRAVTAKYRTTLKMLKEMAAGQLTNPQIYRKVMKVAIKIVTNIAGRNPFYLCSGNPKSLVLPTHPRFGSHYKPRPGARPATARYTYYGYEWFSQLLRMIKSGGPKNLKAWVRLAKEGVVKCHILSPTGVHAWPKMWATKLEAQLQLMFMPTRLHRRPLHQGTCRNYSTAPGITGVIELTSAFYRMYPFNKETAAKGTYRGEEETAASWWLKHVG